MSVFLYFPASESRWCYECGTGVEGQPDCEEFALASTWQAFWRECPKDSICVKILPAWPTERNGQLEAELIASPLLSPPSGLLSTSLRFLLLCFVALRFFAFPIDAFYLSYCFLNLTLLCLVSCVYSIIIIIISSITLTFLSYLSILQRFLSMHRYLGGV